MSASTNAQRRRSRWRTLFQLSLRSLLMLLLALGIWLGLTFNRVRQQRAAVARIEQLGGKIQYAHDVAATRIVGRPQQPVVPGPTWLRRLLGPEFFDTVVWVRLGNTAVTDADLRLISKLDRLEFLDLNSTSITDAGLFELRHCRHLKSLSLPETRVTDDGLRHLPSMPYAAGVSLGNTAVGDEGLYHLRGQRGLVSLELCETHVTSQGVRHLRDCDSMDYLGMRDTAVDDAALEALMLMRRLGTLEVTGTKISGRGLQTLRENLPETEIAGHLVDLGGTPLQKLSYTATQWAPLIARIVALDGEDRLKLIDLRWCNFDDEQLSSLHALKHAELIDLRHSDVTEGGAAALRKALPNCEVLH
jgi:internalin A